MSPDAPQPAEQQSPDPASAVGLQDRGAADPFAPAGTPWTPVSPRLATARRISLAITAVFPLAAAVLLLLLPAVPKWIGALVLAATAVGVLWGWWFIGRRVASFGYSERADDLLVTSGVLFRRLVIVPYGRMQLVDLAAGPLDRAMGVATVQLHTAAATTDATIPGLPPDVAAGLRDRLAALGEQRSAGL